MDPGDEDVFLSWEGDVLLDLVDMDVDQGWHKNLDHELTLATIVDVLHEEH